MDLDRLMVHAVHGATGEIQMEAHEVGIEHVAEADVRRAVRRALQLQLGPFVVPEGARGFKLADWPGRLLGPDVVVKHPGATAHRAFAEIKWCRENTMFEVLWDLLKLSLAVSLDRIDGSYLVVGAPDRAWLDDAWGCSALLADNEWATRELFAKYGGAWTTLLGGNKTARPTRLPSTVATTLLAQVPVHIADGEDWEVRVVKVEDRQQGWVEFRDGWPVA